MHGRKCAASLLSGDGRRERKQVQVGCGTELHRITPGGFSFASKGPASADARVFATNASTSRISARICSR